MIYEEFRDKCIRDNHIQANQLDINDGKTNVKAAMCVSSVFDYVLILVFGRVFRVLYGFYHFQVVISGFRGTSYPDDQLLQKQVYEPLVSPVATILGQGVVYELFLCRGVLRGSTLPPCDVSFVSPAVATRFRIEGARLSRAKQEGLAHLFFNPCITLSTRLVIGRVIFSLNI